MSTDNYLQHTETYRTMTSFEATGYAEGFVEAESEEVILIAWQWLHDSRIAYQLQGWFGRNASRLVQEGRIQP